MTGSDYETMFEQPPPGELVVRAKERRWPDGLVERAWREPWGPRAVTAWLADDTTTTTEQVERVVSDFERLNTGTLRLRQAHYGDDYRLTELFASAPEEIGDWDVTVERGPAPLAQFDLQENAYVSLIEDRGVLLSCYANSVRNTLVGGKRLSVAVTSAYRTRKEARGRGLSNLIRATPPALGTPWSTAQYWYMRADNHAALEWLKALGGTFHDAVAGGDGAVSGIPVTVLQYPAIAGPPSGAELVRKARRSDTRRCVALINRTHRGLDLFRPYSEEYLQSRLDQGAWDWKPPWWANVYSWSDYFVVERDGQITACGGLWDRGAYVRERWRNRVTGEDRVIEVTNLLDFGYAAGAEADMARLVEYFLATTAELGRSHLVAPFQFLPDVARLLEHHEPVTERRGMGWQVALPEGGMMTEPDPPMRRPYTDVSYW